MRLAATTLILFAIAPALPAQEVREIRRGQSVSATLAPDSEHRYALALDANTYVLGAVNQLTVDAVVTIEGPGGETVRRFDSPSRGPEMFHFDAEEAGRYVILVTPFEEGEGDYAIEVIRVERVATNPRDRVDQLLLPFTGDDTPGAVVGVVEDGELKFTRAYGMANLPHAIPFDEGTISNIGSVTKQFTAMGLLLLQAEGKLSLRDDIRSHLTELPDFGTPVSLKNLLNHTGGYREVYNLLPMAGHLGENGLTRDKVMQIVQRQPDLQAQPNTEFNYNNTGYILLTMVIERVSGMSFDDYMQEKVFTPLGMHDTRVRMYQGEVISGRADGYVNAEDGGYRAVRDLGASAGAGGIHSTVRDLATWMLNYRDRRLGGPEAIAAITSNTILESGDSTGYGLGLGIGTFRGRTRYQHTGGDVAHRTYFGYFPEFEGGVIVMSNNGSFNLGVAQDIALAFFEDEFEPEEPDDEMVASADMSAARLAAIAGHWRIVAPTASLDIEYTVDDGELFAQATNQPRFKVVPTSDSTAAFEGVEATVTFHFERDGTVDRATHHQGPSVPMERVDRVELTADDLAAFTGRYYSDELETLLVLRIEDGALTAHNIRMEPFALAHRDEDEFSGGGFPFNTITFRRTGSGRLTGFMASNGRTKNVWFRKQ